MRFSQWKAKIIAYLLSLANTASDQKLRSDINALVIRIKYARAMDLASVLVLLHHFAEYHKIDITKLLPSQEDIDEWFSGIEE